MERKLRKGSTPVSVLGSWHTRKVWQTLAFILTICNSSERSRTWQTTQEQMQMAPGAALVGRGRPNGQGEPGSQEPPSPTLVRCSVLGNTMRGCFPVTFYYVSGRKWYFRVNLRTWLFLEDSGSIPDEWPESVLLKRQQHKGSPTAPSVATPG